MLKSFTKLVVFCIAIAFTSCEYNSGCLGISIKNEKLVLTLVNLTNSVQIIAPPVNSYKMRQFNLVFSNKYGEEVIYPGKLPPYTYYTNIDKLKLNQGESVIFELDFSRDFNFTCNEIGTITIYFDSGKGFSCSASCQISPSSTSPSIGRRR